MLTRRRFLVGAGAVVAAGAVGTEVLGTDRVLHKLGLRGSPDVHVPRSGWPVETGTLPSVAVRRAVGWGIAKPPDGKVDGVIVCLHGHGGDHTFAFDAVRVHDVVAYVKAPLAVAAVDGGVGSYWHKRKDGTDAGAMLLAEFLPFVREHLGVTEIALLGWSMGGYGALLAAERTTGIQAVAAGSPALFRSASDATPGAFDGPADFAANNVFDRTPQAKVRIDCGTHDPFLAEARAFAAKIHATSSFTRGYHDTAYWRSIAPTQVRWLASSFTSK